MVITKKALARRTFIRGVGVTLALPLLDAMVPALTAHAKTPAKPVRRLSAVYAPNGAVVGLGMRDGTIMDTWTPEGDETNLRLSPILKPLEPFRRDVAVVSGLASKPADSQGDAGGDHGRALAAFLSAAHAKRSEHEPYAGTTIDQIAAQYLGHDTQLPAMQLAVDDFGLVGNCEQGYACSYKRSLSWRSPAEPLPSQINPRVVFERMFGEGGGEAARRAQLEADRSILDSITDEVTRLQTRLGARDRGRLTEYVDGVRELELRINKIEAQQGTLALELPDLPAGIPDTFEDHVKLMFDLQVLAFAGDISRVTTFLLAIEGSYRSYPQIGVPDAHHGLSHHGQDPEKVEKMGRINTYHTGLFAYFLQKLQSTPDGDGSLLDHSLVLYGSGMSDGNLHSHSPLPLLLAGGAGGRLKGGRHLRYEAGTPMANLLVSMLNLVDVPVDTIGDSSGPLTGV